MVKSDVKKLSLHFATGYYDLPQSILVAKSIIMLILRQCKLDTNCGDINFPFVKKLSLSYVDADDKTVSITSKDKIKFVRDDNQPKIVANTRLQSIPVD